MPSAAAFSAPGSAPGALLLHGFTGSPASLRPLAEAIASAGYALELPLLPGHGTSPEDLATRSYADWLEAAEAGYDALLARAGSVVTIGLSMGGALALELGWRRDPAGLVLVNPLVQPASSSFLTLLEQMLATGAQFLPSIGSDIAEPGGAGEGYDQTPIAPMLSLFEALPELARHLDRLRCPVLLCSSRTDHVVPPENGDFVAATLGDRVRRVFLEKSYHVATLDYDASLIESETVAFLAARKGER